LGADWARERIIIALAIQGKAISDAAPNFLATQTKLVIIDIRWLVLFEIEITCFDPI
jgi:hypothetical protein